MQSVSNFMPQMPTSTIKQKHVDKKMEKQHEKMMSSKSVVPDKSVVKKSNSQVSQIKKMVAQKHGWKV